MSLLNRLKDAANHAKQASSSLGATSAVALWGKYGDSVCSAVYSYVSQAATKGGAFVADDAKYKTGVVDPAWELLPAPVRLLGRERLKWDAFFNAARAKLFVIDGEHVTVHPNAKQRIDQMFAGMLSVSELRTIDADLDGVDDPAKTDG